MFEGHFAEAPKMKTTQLGSLTVSQIGYGSMGLSQSFGALPSEDEAITILRNAYSHGCRFFDTSEGYGPYTNEVYIGKAFHDVRDQIVIATKMYPAIFPGQEHLAQKLSREGLREALEGSLKRLQTAYVDLYYLHRIPVGTNMAEVAVWFGELIKEGKIKGWGISEATAEQIRAAHAVTPLTAVQNEWSMLERKWTPELQTCKELGIGFVAFAPLAEGFLSGKYTKATEFKGFDIRRVITRFQPENMEANQPVLDLLHEYAKKKNATAAQIALAWVIADGIVPLVGMRSEARIVENLGAIDVSFTSDELQDINRRLDSIEIKGDRKDSDIAKLNPNVKVFNETK